MPTSSKDNTLNKMLSLNVVLQFALTSNHSDIKHACFSDSAPQAELECSKTGAAPAVSGILQYSSDETKGKKSLFSFLKGKIPIQCSL